MNLTELDDLYLHGETELLDAVFAISGPWCRLIVITLQQIPPHQEARLAFGWPVLHHLKEVNDAKQNSKQMLEVTRKIKQVVFFFKN